MQTPPQSRNLGRGGFRLTCHGNVTLMNTDPRWIDGVWRFPANGFENCLDALTGLDFLLWESELGRGRSPSPNRRCGQSTPIHIPKREVTSQSCIISSVTVGVDILRAAIQEFRTTGAFPPRVVPVNPAMASSLVRLQFNPTRFDSNIFQGDWALPDKHPDTTEIRLLRVLDSPDGVHRVVGRQGRYLYAFPWVA